MRTIHFTKLLLFVAVISAAFTATTSADTFRGIPIPFNGNAQATPTHHDPMYVDASDNFARDGFLVNTVVDGFRTGYVPPFEIDPLGNEVAEGPLTGAAASLAGRWMQGAGKDFVTTSLGGGSVSRVTDEGAAVACLPWRVTPELGRGYLIEMTAIVSEGETVTLGYFGDVDTYGTDQGLDAELGQLVLGISRGTQAQGTQDKLYWQVAWDDEGERRTVTGREVDSAVGEEIRMQLRWDDIRDSGNDLFDAWVATDAGQNFLSSGDMSTEIDVFGAGFEMNGTGSAITGFATAVPEPTAGLLSLLGLLFVVKKTRK